MYVCMYVLYVSMFEQAIYMTIGKALPFFQGDCGDKKRGAEMDRKNSSGGEQRREWGENHVSRHLFRRKTLEAERT